MPSESRNRIKQNYLAMPENVKNAIWSFSRKYKEAGYECYLVGGSCRDLLLNEVPYDYDFATNCPLSQTKRMFRKVINIGESHGTLVVFYRGLQFEITRYRKDVKTDGRKAIIEYSDSIEEDQKRRDLRLNALAYSVIDDVIVDSQSGLTDVEEKKIRFVGQAEERIREDHLRALRYGRLIAKLMPLGFGYDQQEMEAVIRVFDNSVLSIERIYDELTKIIAVGARIKPFLLDYLPKLTIFNRYFDDPADADLAIRMIIETGSLLPLPFLFLKKKSMREAVAELKLSRKNKRLLYLIGNYDKTDLRDPLVVKELLSNAGDTSRDDIITAVRDLLGIDIEEQVRSIVSARTPYRLKDLRISGSELIDMGLSGDEVGKTLQRLLEKVWESPSLNEKPLLMELAQKEMS